MGCLSGSPRGFGWVGPSWGGICIRGFWIGGRGRGVGGGGALTVLGGFIAQSICKCVVRKLILYLVYTEFIILEIKSHFTCGELNLF